MATLPLLPVSSFVPYAQVWQPSQQTQEENVHSSFCNLLSALAGLAGGADAAYIYEEKFSIKDLQQDVYHMASKMAEGVQRGLILR